MKNQFTSMQASEGFGQRSFADDVCCEPGARVWMCVCVCACVCSVQKAAQTVSSEPCTAQTIKDATLSKAEINESRKEEDMLGSHAPSGKKKRHYKAGKATSKKHCLHSFLFFITYGTDFG